MRIIYCDNVADNKVIEPDYAEERISAQKAGFSSSLISFEELERGQINKSLRLIKESETKEKAIYRGWMLTPLQYTHLYEGLRKKNIELINTPEEYKHCHYLPESYSKIEGHTPESKWTSKTDLPTLIELAAQFGTMPIIVKDFVKSEKHNWVDACFIPDASDAENVKSVTQKFIELRGSWLNEGLVFRKFEELEFLTKHSKSGMPLTKEFRLIFANKSRVALLNYWDEGIYDDNKPPIQQFEKIAEQIESNFFTMDIAQKKNGEWIIMELGDAQVAGLPDKANLDAFYQNLKQLF